MHIARRAILLLCTLCIFAECYSQSSWQKITYHPDSSGLHSANANVVNGIAYIAFGYTQNSSVSKKIWAYDIVNGTWTPKSDFPDAARYCVASFAIKDSIYYVSGADDSNLYLDQFWAYSVIADTWTQKQYPAGSRLYATAFTIDGKGYVFGGRTTFQTVSIENNTLWQYDPGTGNWAQKKSMADNYNRFMAAAFVLDSKGYVLGGRTGSSFYFNDTWQYDPVKDSWAQKAARPNGYSSSAIAFTLYRDHGEKGYYGLGINSQSYPDAIAEYDPGADNWKSMAAFPDKGRANSIVFVYNNEAYIGLGESDVLPMYKKDIWKLSVPDTFTDTLFIKGIAHQEAGYLKYGQIKALNSTNNYIYTTYTDSTGHFTFDSLSAGTYILKSFPNTGEKYHATFYPNTTDSLRAFKLTMGGSIYDADLFMLSNKTDSAPGEIVHEHVSIYPNPFNKSLKVTASSNTVFTRIQILYLTGGIQQEVIFDKGTHFHELNMANMVNGIYILKVESDKGTFLKKIIKE